VDFIKDADKDYASIYALFSPSFNINRSEHQTKIPVTFYFMDLVNVSEDTKNNETEVYSDMLSVAQDFKAMLESSTYQDDWTITEDSSAQFLFEEFDDIVAGVSLEITIGVEYASDRCQVPASDITFETDSNDMRTYEAYRKCIGDEGYALDLASDFTDMDGNTLDITGKRIILLLRSNTVHKKITSGTPTIQPESQFKHTATQVEFNPDATLSENEAILLLYRNNN
jgi:hypothetical protein